MRQAVVPGKTIEAVTPAELDKALGEFAGRVAASRDKRTQRPSGALRLDATGAGIITIYAVPLGMEFALHRLLIDADGFTPGAPYNAAAGYVDILRGDERVDFLSLAAGSGAIPAVFSAGDSDAVRFRNGEQVNLRVVGGPVSTTVQVRAQGTLAPFSLA